LFYWLSAGAIKVLGLSIWSLRSVNALLSLLGCIATYFTARKLYGRATGLLSAFILGTCTLYFVMGNMVSLDLPVTVFLAICLYAFLLGTQAPYGRQRLIYLSFAAAMAGLAVLTKGLIGLVFPGLIITAWIMTTRQWQLVKRLYLPACVLIFLLIATPWHLFVAHRNPGFLHFYFVEQHFLRYTTMDVGHYQPVWFFIPAFIAGFFPWIVMLPAALYHASFKSKRDSFLLIWAIVIFLFFSFSKSKLIPYILPVFPPLAILTGHYLAQDIQKRVKALCILIALACLSLMSLMAAAPTLDTRSIRPLALQLKPLLQPQDEVITYNQYYQDLPFYLERRVSILNWKNELTHGMMYQDTREWMINDQQFWQRWTGKKRVYVLISRNEYEKMLKQHSKIHPYLIGSTMNNILISNYPDPRNP
jgi:4-amino-4-deoxy-L-arabinose transferase-like glycosyltransferase